jgi:HEAT repeats
MGKRGRVLIAVAAIAVLAVLAWTVLRSSAPEPVYQGKPLSYWLQGYDVGPAMNMVSVKEADEAVHAICTNAIPTLLQMLRAHDSPLKTELLVWAKRHHIPGIHYARPINLNFEASLAFYALGSQATNAIPDLIDILDQNISDGSINWTAAVLGSMGPRAAAAVPALLRVPKNTNGFAYGSVLYALGRIHAKPDEAVPVLITALKDPSAANRSSAIFALGRFQGDAKSAVPALVTIINEPSNNSNSIPLYRGTNITIRMQVEQALQQIDPETYYRVVTNAVETPIPYR